MKKIYVFLLSIFFYFQFSFAWIGLIAEVGDILDTTKRNEMIDVLDNKIDTIINTGSGIGIFLSKYTNTAYFKTITGGNHIALLENNNTISINFTGALESSPIPYINTDTQISVPINTTKTISISGINFIPNSTVSIPGFPGTINSVVPVSPFQIDVNITTDATTGVYDIVVSNNGVLNTLWTGNGQGLLKVFDPNNINIDMVYSIASNSATRDDMKTQLLDLGLLLTAIPTTNNVAEQLNVVDVTGGALSDGQITNLYKTTPVSEIYIVYYLNDAFQFVARIWKNDGTTTTIDEYTDTVATLYNREVKYNNTLYTGTVNFNFASSRARRWTVGNTFSPDDGGWGIGSGDIDFDNPGPYLYQVSDSWGFGNMNSSDGSNSNKLYINGTENNGTVVAYVFLKQ